MFALVRRARDAQNEEWQSPPLNKFRGDCHSDFSHSAFSAMSSYFFAAAFLATFLTAFLAGAFLATFLTAFLATFFTAFFAMFYFPPFIPAR